MSKAALAKGGHLARSVSWRAFKERPSLSNATRLATARLGPVLLDVRRRLSRPMGGASQRDMSLLPEQSIRGIPAAERIDFANFAPYLCLVADLEAAPGVPIGQDAPAGSDIEHRLGGIQRLFERYDVVPTYAVDHAFANCRPLQDAFERRKCEIGALFRRSWDARVARDAPSGGSDPEGSPEAETIGFEKLRLLTSAIETNFGCRPVLFRSPGHDLTLSTASALDRLGYRIDCSVVPHHDLRSESGLDFRHSPTTPYWFGPGNRLLEIPVTVGITGLLARSTASFAPLFDSSSSAQHVRRALTRMSLLERIRLDPDAASPADAKRLTRALLRRGHRVMLLSCRDRARTADDLAAFVRWIESYLDFFFGEIGGLPATPSIILTEAAFASHPTRISYRERAVPVG
jgi:hypothetical protein